MSDKNNIKRAMNEVLNERFKMPQGAHNADHDWVRLKREKEHRRVERWEKWKTSAGGAIIVGGLALLGGALTWVFNNFMSIVHFIGGDHGTH